MLGGKALIIICSILIITVSRRVNLSILPKVSQEKDPEILKKIAEEKLRLKKLK